MPRIWLPNEVPVLVSPCDYEWLREYTWWESFSKKTQHSYAYTLEELPRSPDGKRRRKKIYMHRLITNAPPSMIADHRNRDTLDNRRGNLRLATKAQNASNRGAWGAIPFKGVDLVRTTRRFRARVRVEGEQIYIGQYDTAIQAALAYDRKASSIWGEFAWLNFPAPAEPGDAIERELAAVPF